MSGIDQLTSRLGNKVNSGGFWGALKEIGVRAVGELAKQQMLKEAERKKRRIKTIGTIIGIIAAFAFMWWRIDQHEAHIVELIVNDYVSFIKSEGILSNLLK